MQSQQDPLGIYISFSYDNVGNTVRRVNARNLTTTYTLDALYRTVGTLYSDSSRVTNTYDAVGQQLTQQDLTGITTYGYDLAGRQTSVVYPTGKTLTSAFDPVGNRTLLIDSDGGLTTYTWDIQNRLVGLLNPFSEKTTIVYDALDREQHKILANAMSVSHTYNPASRQLVLANFGPTGNALAVFTSSYDPVGNRLSVLELDATQVTFSYDASYQLIREQRSGVNAYDTTYIYDPMGNRILQNGRGQLTTYTYNAANALTLLTPSSGPPTTSSYDGSGNLVLENTGGALNTYTWDFENRLLSFASASDNETYVTSTDGKRQKKVIGATSTNFVWDGVNVLLEANGVFQTQAHYTDGPGRWGGLTSENRSGASSFYGFDSQGSTRILVSVGGSVTDSYSYKAFGVELASGSGTVNPYRYVGQYGYYRDTSSRNYVRARYLRTDLGRWMSRDPAVFSGGDWNLYRYVQNNSINSIDSNGLDCSYDDDDCYKDSQCCKDYFKNTKIRNSVKMEIDNAIKQYLSCLVPKKVPLGAAQNAFRRVMLCIAYGESTWDKHCRGDDRTVLGIFQLNKAQFKRCGDKTKHICMEDANIQAGINMVIGQCQTKSISLNESLINLFGAYRKNQGKNFHNCMNNSGFNEDNDRYLLQNTYCCGCNTIKGCNG